MLELSLIGTQSIKESRSLLTFMTERVMHVRAELLQLFFFFLHFDVLVAVFVPGLCLRF